ncbi:MAG: flavodoxin family protein [Lachnospiraceae bacterium]|jgi:multimeric flavodoxin WrbA|nr:flavodoxin family protein [Lachnospiraceae bacterium]
MKVLLVNGSPNKEGCTNRALQEIAMELAKSGIKSEIFWLGKEAIMSCASCGACNSSGRCAFGGPVNEFLDKAYEADGFIFGSPVHYAAASGAITSFLGRVFFAGSRNIDSPFYLKPGASVASARRAGTTSTFDQLNKFFTISNMPIISGGYWNMVHGFTPEDVEKDEEGLQNMRVIGRNMAWFLKVKEAGIKANVPYPIQEDQIATNFIR